MTEQVSVLKYQLLPKHFKAVNRFKRQVASRTISTVESTACSPVRISEEVRTTPHRPCMTILTVPAVPAMMRDTQTRLEEFGDSGTTNPFDTIHSLVFQLTVRNVGCNDIADDRALLEKTRGIYETMENSYNPSIIVLPWIVKAFTPSFINQAIAGARLYFILKGVVDKRKKTGERQNDTLQYLLDQGDDLGKMIGVSTANINDP
tara:strand:+ start:576 stop:1190 length:615 start_codon:yes stop_codon:yes gene_type:complete